jgi:hypothetical protein
MEMRGVQFAVYRRIPLTGPGVYTTGSTGSFGHDYSGPVPIPVLFLLCASTLPRWVYKCTMYPLCAFPSQFRTQGPTCERSTFNC